MLRCKRRGFAVALVPLALAIYSANALAGPIQTVFVISMENHNWTQPASETSVQQIFKNPNAPFINGLVNGTAFATINGVRTDISKQVSYATAYHNVLATPSGNNPSIHPSEPNYIWGEAGTNFGVLSDNDPYDPTGPTNQNSAAHLATYLSNSGKTWRSYQEDIDLVTTNGAVSNTVRPKNQWTVPLSSFSGTFVSGTNAYNGSNQYDYAAKHNPQVFFTDTNGGNNPASSNRLAHQYAPLQQLVIDLKNNSVANYNWITPDEFNDMHTALPNGFMGLTGDSAEIRQGDSFLSKIIPVIMSSKAYQNNGAIILWWDETEGNNPDDFSHTLPEIVISPNAHLNVNGLPYASTMNYTHTSDLLTMEEIFGVAPNDPLTKGATDLSNLFAAGAIPGHGPSPTPEPATSFLVGGGVLIAVFFSRKFRGERR